MDKAPTAPKAAPKAAETAAKQAPSPPKPEEAKQAADTGASGRIWQRLASPCYTIVGLFMSPNRYCEGVRHCFLVPGVNAHAYAASHR